MKNNNVWYVYSVLMAIILFIIPALIYGNLMSKKEKETDDENERKKISQNYRILFYITFIILSLLYLSYLIKNKLNNQTILYLFISLCLILFFRSIRFND